MQDLKLMQKERFIVVGSEVHLGTFAKTKRKSIRKFLSKHSQYKDWSAALEKGFYVAKIHSFSISIEDTSFYINLKTTR